MAKQTSIIPFTGKLGNLIGYERNGEYFLRTMPEIVRQTHATRRAARRFGMVSRKAALIRHAFYSDLDIPCDNGHVNRLNKVLIAAGRNHEAITGFRFNQHTGIDRFFTVVPRLLENDILHVPAQTISQYKGLNALEVKVIAARIDFIRGQITGTGTTILMINPDMPFEETNIPLDIPGAGTLVVTLQVRGMHKDGVSGNRQHLAADIIAVVAPQIQKCFSKPTYPRRASLRLQTNPGYMYAHAYQSTIQRE